MFIEVTLQGEKQTDLINSRFIVSVVVDADRTRLTMHDGELLYVEEHYEEIKGMLSSTSIADLDYQ